MFSELCFPTAFKKFSYWHKTWMTQECPKFRLLLDDPLLLLLLTSQRCDRFVSHWDCRSHHFDGRFERFPLFFYYTVHSNLIAITDRSSQCCRHHRAVPPALILRWFWFYPITLFSHSANRRIPPLLILTRILFCFCD